MEEKLDSMSGKLQTSPNSLESKTLFLRSINDLVLAQNIIMSKEAVMGWYGFCLEDIANQSFEFEDFIKATKEYLRTPLSYGRLAYPDCYVKAIQIFKHRKAPQTKFSFVNDPNAVKDISSIKNILNSVEKEITESE